MGLANQESEFQQKERRQSMVLVDLFTKMSAVAAATVTYQVGKSITDEQMNTLKNFDITSMPLALDYIGPAAMAFFGYGLLKEASIYFKTKAGSHVGVASEGSSEREYNEFMRNQKKQWKFNPFTSHNGFKNSTPGVNFSPQLSVNDLKIDMALARFIDLHYRTVPEIIGNVSVGQGAAKQIARPIKGALKFVSYLPFLRIANRNINNARDLFKHSFNPEKLYAEQRQRQFDLTGDPESDRHSSPYHAYSQGDINMLHLAALVGADPTPIGKQFRKMPCMQDPAIQDVFNNATDILDGLKKNTKKLRTTMKALYNSLGELSQDVLSKPGDFISSMKEWESLTFDIYEYGVKQSANMNTRQLGTETFLQLSTKLNAGELTKKDAQEILDKLNGLASLKNREYTHRQNKASAPFLSLGSHAEAISETLSVAINTSKSWPLAALHIPKAQQDIFSINTNQKTEDALKEMHDALHGSSSPYPSETIIQEMCIDKLMSTVEEKLKKSLKANDPTIKQSALDKKADLMMGEWHQRAAVQLSKKM
tara:strand:+ start:2521 stop:4134 length:1614 start_codon:yes stop_codon:yes gene_type:complete